MRSFTEFDSRQRYILLQISVANKNGKIRDFLALLDTGAPATEFSDDVLQYLGFLESTNQQVKLQHGMQTQKYGQVILPHVEICYHTIKNLKVYVSHFEKSWGIDALIGLDFFRAIKIPIVHSALVMR